jgi:hypothetical protein
MYGTGSSMAFKILTHKYDFSLDQYLAFWKVKKGRKFFFDYDYIDKFKNYFHASNPEL